jgi:hypothetical protein
MPPALKQALATPDGQTLKRVTRALLRARCEASHPRSAPFTFPCTEAAFCQVARRAGIAVGQKHARDLIRLATSTGLFVPHSGYTSKRGCTVRLYRLGCRIVGLRFAQGQAAVGTREVVKPRVRAARLRWWLHPLFGMPDGLPPPDMRGKSRVARRRKWRSADEKAAA